MSMQGELISIEVARRAEDHAIVAELFREYQAWLDQPVCFQNFEEELASLPGAYAPPTGELWLARRGAEPVAVVGMVPSHDERCANACEMKRLYVRDSAKGLGLGRKLADGCVSWARDAGYTAVVLETFPSLEAAWSLYQSMGFEVVPAEPGKPLNSPDFLIYSLG